MLHGRKVASALLHTSPASGVLTSSREVRGPPGGPRGALLRAGPRSAGPGGAAPLPRRGERPASVRPSGAACAKRPHGRLRRLSAELENVGEASDFLADFLERRAHGRVPAAFWKNPEKNWLNLAKIQQHFGKIWQIYEILGKNSKKFSNF